ncbi:hypothetical protein [Planctomicrobium sp. SH527]|uniref:hypothetical protein n=1 Tax=Planctomicrobium sp. SH527 TaxID=3448123 RepID=UPI003F5BC0FC
MKPIVSTPDFEQLASLVATGEILFPEGLAESQQQELAERVRKLRRHRLLQVVARAIVFDLERQRLTRH